MASVTAELSFDGLLLNGRLFKSPVQPSAYAAVLEAPGRVEEPATLAPYGHRNNQIHLFDELGLYLIEHHTTRLIDAVVFVLWLEESPFKPAREFVGRLTVGGLRVFPGMLAREFSGSTIPFQGPVLGLWSAEKDGVWIGLSAHGIRQKSGHRGKHLRFESVSACFSFLPHLSQDEDRLGVLAMKFRGTRQDAERVAIAADYAAVVDRLIRGGQWHEIPSPEDQLPDAWMPKTFFDYWTRPTRP